MENINKEPLVTVITIVYNGEKYIQEAIDSLKNQTYKNFEYIIVDGGSTDHTLDIIKNNLDVISSYTSEKDDGISDAFNKGIAQAKGNIIGLINSDDIYEPKTLEHVVQSYLQNKLSEGIYYGDIRYFKRESSFELMPELKKIWNYMSIFHPAVFVTKSVYDKYGSFSLNYKYAMDCEFIHRCLKNNVSFFYVDQVLSNFRLEGVSDVNYKKSYREFYQSVKEHGNNPLASFYYVLGITKKSILRTKLGNYISDNRSAFTVLMWGKYKKYK